MIFDEFQPTKANAEMWAGSFLKMGVAIKVLEYTGIDRWINSDPNTITRNLKRGVGWYVANETVEELTTMNSNGNIPGHAPFEIPSSRIWITIDPPINSNALIATPILRNEPAHISAFDFVG